MNLPTSGKKLNQLRGRGWTEDSVRETVQSAHTTRAATNKSNGNSATAYYNRDGSHVVVDDVTGDIVQFSNRNSPESWVPDSSIQNPYLPPSGQ